MNHLMNYNIRELDGDRHGAIVKSFGAEYFAIRDANDLKIANNDKNYVVVRGSQLVWDTRIAEQALALLRSALERKPKSSTHLHPKSTGWTET